MTVLVRLPYPYAELSPNSKGPKFWATRAKFVEVYKKEAWSAAVNVRINHGLTAPIPPPVGMRIVYVVARGGRRDGDNHLAWLKAGFDGLVAARLLEDDSLDKLKLRELEVLVAPGLVALNKGLPYVLIELEHYEPISDPATLAARLADSAPPRNVGKAVAAARARKTRSDKTQPIRLIGGGGGGVKSVKSVNSDSAGRAGSPQLGGHDGYKRGSKGRPGSVLHAVEPGGRN